MSPQFTLAQISDCHLFADKTKDGYAGINPYQSLQQVLFELSKQHLDTVLVTGDISGDYSEQSYDHFTRLWQESGITAPLVGLPGNHDNIEVWKHYFGHKNAYLCIPLHFGNWHLHLLPSDFKGGKGLLQRDATEQLFANIKASYAGHHIVALHHPLTFSGEWMDKHHLLNPQLFTRHMPAANLRCILHGHVHTERQVIVQKTPVLACPSTCWQWGNSADFSLSEQAPGFRTIKLNQDGQFSTATHYLRH